jgi:hypothetical protein
MRLYFDLTFEIVHKQQVIMFSERIEEFLVVFVGRDEYRAFFRQLVFGILVNLGRVNARRFELKVPTTNMKGVKNAIRIAHWVSVAGVLSNFVH